jgi:hypothetical protein
VFALAFPLGYATIGLVMALRRPANPIGWLFAVPGLLWSITIPFDPWLDQLILDGRPLPLLAKLDAIATEYNWAPAIAFGITLPALLVPDGRLRSPRWRAVAAAAVAGPLLGLLGGALASGMLEETVVPIDNPFRIGGVAVAVLRYRLWDLDRLVSRTVTYALVTTLLVVPYLLILPAATRLAGGSGSLAVAAATLAAAALFQPLRRRVQDLVDRRFNRRRYDAARTVDAFAVRLRDQVDLTALHAELLAVVDQTVAPTQASLWLRPPAFGPGLPR